MKSNKKPITTTLTKETYDFLVIEAKKENTSRREILEKALRLYKKIILEEQVKKGLKEREEEYRNTADEFFLAQNSSMQKT
jgi:hypothetical protein